jgi:hypothetical protein
MKFEAGTGTSLTQGLEQKLPFLVTHRDELRRMMRDMPPAFNLIPSVLEDLIMTISAEPFLAFLRTVPQMRRKRIAPPSTPDARNRGLT